MIRFPCFRNLLLSGCLCCLWVGCSPPPEPSSQSDHATASASEQAEHAAAAPSSDPPAAATASGQSTDSAPAPSQRTENVTPPAGQRAAAGLLPPANASQAANMAEEQMKISEGNADLSEAYHHASRALFCARQFPDDPTCVGLADAASGRLQKLEAALNSRALPRTNGLLPDKAIIEIP